MEKAPIIYRGQNFTTEKRFTNELVNKQTFLSADMLTCHGKKGTGVAKSIHNGSLLFKCPPANES